MDHKRRSAKARRRNIVLVGVAAAIILVVGATIALYMRTPNTNKVYCGVYQYIEFPARTLVHGSAINTTETMTTAVTFTTTTFSGRVGDAYSNSTTSTNSLGEVGAVETICEYIATTSST